MPAARGSGPASESRGKELTDIRRWCAAAACAIGVLLITRRPPSRRRRRTTRSNAHASRSVRWASRLDRTDPLRYRYERLQRVRRSRSATSRSPSRRSSTPGCAPDARGCTSPRVRTSVYFKRYSSERSIGRRGRPRASKCRARVSRRGSPARYVSGRQRFGYEVDLRFRRVDAGSWRQASTLRVGGRTRVGVSARRISAYEPRSGRRLSRQQPARRARSAHRRASACSSATR